MARELGSSQISALLESVPGIVNVLRSPVADALVAMIRAGAGLEEFDRESANELVQYAVRRGLISSGEGDQLLEDVKASGAGKGRRRKAAPRKAAPRPTPPLVARRAGWGRPSPHAKTVDAAKAKPEKAKPQDAKPKKAKPKKAKPVKGKSKPKAKLKKATSSKAKSGKSDKKPVKRSTRR